LDWWNGQDRRQWLNEKNEQAGNALRYYLGPAAAPVNALANVAGMLSPGADMMDMAQSSHDLMSGGGWADAGWLGASALGMALPGNASMLREAAAEVPGIRAYHGSPHDFDAFSMDKIGTGEGAQAYGHGLYFADKEGVAHDYRQKLSPIDETALAAAIPEKWRGHARSFASTADSPDLAVRDFTAWTGAADTPEVRQAFADAMKNRGHMYEVNINANPDDFLDWDKPLSEQSEKVRASYGYEPKPTYEEEEAAFNIAKAASGGDSMAISEHPAVREIYRRMYAAGDADKAFQREVGGGAGPGPDSAASLREKGVPGIRYLDQGSRTAGEGSRNYVVFDDSLISILRKYGLMGAVGGGALGMNALRPDDQERF
jgi:hypothetical protein